MGSIFHLKCCFKRIQEKNIRNFSLRSLLFVYCRLSVYRSALIFKNLPCPEKFLIIRLRCLESAVSAVMRKQCYETLLSNIKAFCLTQLNLWQKHMKFIYRFRAKVKGQLRLSGWSYRQNSNFAQSWRYNTKLHEPNKENETPLF